MKKALCLFFSFLFVLCGATGSLRATSIPTGVYYRASTTDKKIAITFDDGPHPVYTDKILSLLKEEEVVATFFAIGSNVEMSPSVVKHILRDGHEIGNHTYSHPAIKRITNEFLEEEIEKTDRLLAELGAPRPSLFRPPQGICPGDFLKVLKDTGKIAILWNIDTRDWAHTPSDEIVESVLSSIGGGDIILFHDSVGGESTTIPAIKKLIPILKERGYQFVTVSELLSPPN